MEYPITAAAIRLLLLLALSFLSKQTMTPSKTCHSVHVTSRRMLLRELVGSFVFVRVLRAQRSSGRLYQSRVGPVQHRNTTRYETRSTTRSCGAYRRNQVKAAKATIKHRAMYNTARLPSWKQQNTHSPRQKDTLHRRALCRMYTITQGWVKAIILRVRVPRTALMFANYKKTKHGSFQFFITTHNNPQHHHTHTQAKHLPRPTSPPGHPSRDDTRDPSSSSNPPFPFGAW